MNKTILTSLTLSSALALSGTAAAAEENPFSAQPLTQGYQLAHAEKSAEGQCGEHKHEEAKCGEGKCGEGKCGEDKSEEAKCGADAKKPDSKDSEGKCGEGKCGEGACGSA